MQSFDFCMVQRDDQDVSVNGMSATINQVDAMLAYFNRKDTDLRFSDDDEEPTVVERRTELFSMMFEMFQQDEGLFAFSSSSLAQIGLRWLAFIIPIKLLDQFVTELGASIKKQARLISEVRLLMPLAEYLAVANPTQSIKHAASKTKHLKDTRTTLNRVDSIRKGRNYIMKSEIGKMTEYLNDAKLLDNK